MWDYILTNPIQGRSFREFRAELMNLTVDYKKESSCEDVYNTKGVSDINSVKTGNCYSCYMLYTEATRATIKSSMDSPQECVEGTHSPKVPGRNQRTRLPRNTEFSCLTAETGSIRILERI